MPNFKINYTIRGSVEVSSEDLADDLGLEEGFTDEEFIQALAECEKNDNFKAEHDDAMSSNDVTIEIVKVQ